MRTGFFSPLPPAKTGVADYSAALLRELRKFGDVEVDAPRADVALYHVGNNHLHRSIYERALREPGVAVIHDAVLHHFFLGTLTEAAYIDEFTFNYGVWSSDEARLLWKNRARSATDSRYFQYPLLKRIAQVSRALIVHNPAAAAMVRDHAPQAMVFEIPHLFELPELAPRTEVDSLRRQLGCTRDTLLLGVFGHLRESKRLLSVIRAFERVRQRANVRLLIAGEFASTDLARAVAPLRNQPGIVWRGYLPEPDFWRHATAVDVGVNLRYPAAGETSGIAIRLMGIGKPVIVTEGEETSRIPVTACLRAESGAGEEDSLVSYFDWLAANPASRASIGHAAASHIQSEHRLDEVARRYWNALQDCYHRSSGPG